MRQGLASRAPGMTEGDHEDVGRRTLAKKCLVVP